MNAILDKPTAVTSRDAARQSLCDQIANLPLFKGLSPAYVEVLADAAMPIRFDAGELIFQEDFPANRFYVILRGSVVLTVTTDEGGVVPIQTVGPGEDLGWSWLFAPYYAHFTARAMESTEAIFFYGTRLRERCERDRDFGYEITKRVAMVLIDNVKALQKELIHGNNTVK